jgi:hypothetical protein
MIYPVSQINNQFKKQINILTTYCRWGFALCSNQELAISDLTLLLHWCAAWTSGPGAAQEPGQTGSGNDRICHLPSAVVSSIESLKAWNGDEVYRSPGDRSILGDCQLGKAAYVIDRWRLSRTFSKTDQLTKIDTRVVAWALVSTNWWQAWRRIDSLEKLRT